eukprot:1865212-Amphidinium_carterae.1
MEKVQTLSFPALGIVAFPTARVLTALQQATAHALCMWSMSYIEIGRYHLPALMRFHMQNQYVYQQGNIAYYTRKQYIITDIPHGKQN